MSLNNYIDNLTKIDISKSVGHVKWSKVVQEKKGSQPTSIRGKGLIPYQCQSEQANRSHSHQRDQKCHREKKQNSHETYHDSIPNSDRHQFAEIIPSVREVGAGYNTYSNEAIERRFKERQAELASKENNDSTASTTYASATSKSTEESFKSATETLRSLKISSDEATNGVLVDDNDEERYKKNALMSGLLQTQYDDFSNTDTSTEHSFGLCNTSQDIESDEDWDKEESNESMFNGRITRFFQSAEDEDVYVHPLKEQVQKDPEWQKYQLNRKGVQVIQTPRQHYLSLDDEQFNFQPRNPQ